MDTSTALKTIPESPGVYIYKDKDGQVIYVGKGINLARRVRQYFTDSDAVGEKTKLLVSQIAAIKTIPTMNEFDALLLEAKLIRQYLPKYNVIARDDKSPLYIQLTLKELLPRVLFVRRPAKPVKIGLFGPFQSARVVRDLMRGLRRVIPYCTQKQRNGRPCFYTHLGLCSPCPSAITIMPDGEEKRFLVHQYRKNIFRLRDMLSGKGNRILLELEKEMKQAAIRNDFEKAAMIRNQLAGLSSMLQKHYDPTFYMEGAGAEDIFEKESTQLIRALSHVYLNLSSLDRIECIDISNLGGKQATGSLVVLTHGQPDKGQYRKFRIRIHPPAGGPNDVAMIAEVLTRRLDHREWNMPDLLVIDGGKGQVGSALNVLKERGVFIPVIGLAKRREEIIVPKEDAFGTIHLPLTSPGLHLLERIRDEAHRFAISYHRLLRKKNSFV